jgi:glycosyltransferase involved in cell wall biosynthesis
MSNKLNKKTLEKIMKQIVQKYGLLHAKLELIIINDGSTDDTEKVVIQYFDRYQYIQYYKQNNEGVSSARNHSLKINKGKYFVDGDDILAKDSLIRIMNRIIANKSDIIFSTYIKSSKNILEAKL